MSVASQSSPSTKSPARRRLPPTPGGASASATSPAISLSMAEPEPYHLPGSSKPSLYNSTSYASFASSSNGPSDLVRRTTAGSNNSAASGPQLAQGYLNGSSHYANDGKRIPMSSSDYQSHRSYTSSLGSPTTNTTTSGDSNRRPPGALPPALPPKPSAYQDFSSESQYSYQLPSFDAYDQDISDDYFYRQSQPQQSRPNKYAPTVVTSQPPLPPLPPLPPAPPAAVNNDNVSDYSPQTTYASSSPCRSPLLRISQARLFIIFQIAVSLISV